MTNKKKNAQKGESQNQSNYTIIKKEISRATVNKPVSVATLCAKTDVTQKTVAALVSRMRSEGIFVIKKDQSYYIGKSKKDKLALWEMYSTKAEQLQSIADALKKNF